MNCRNCGLENDENAKFCSECGMNLYLDYETKKSEKGNHLNSNHKVKKKVVKYKKNRKDRNRKEKKDRNSNKKRMSGTIKFLIGLILILGVSIGGAYLYFSVVTSPDKVAQAYFEATKSGDAGKLYQYMEAEESDFANRKIFIKLMEKKEEEAPIQKVEDYKVIETIKSSDGKTARTTIEYTVKNNKTPKIETVLLTKAKEKVYYVFDKWEISKQTLKTVKDFKIYVMKDSRLKVEGIPVGTQFLDKDLSTKTVDVYKMPSMFALPYEGVAELPLGFSVTEKIDISRYSKKQVISVSSENIPESVKKKLEVAAKENIIKIYEAALSSKKFSDIKDTFDYTGASLNELEEAYTAFTTQLSKEEDKLTKIEFTDITLPTISIASDGSITVIVQVSYEYTINYKDKDKKDKISTGKDGDIMHLVFDAKDARFKLISMSSFETSFK